MRNIYLLLWVLFFSGFVNAQDRLKIAFYNLFEYPKYYPTNRAPTLKNILAEIDPDLFLVCELLTEEGAEDILNNALNYNSNRKFARAAFIPTSTPDSNLQQLLFYDSKKWELLSTETLLTSYRDINKYKLKLHTYDALDPIYLYAFVTHLKSSTGRANRLIRLEMVENLIHHLESIEPDALVLFAGDFNLYTSEEEAYQALLNKQNPIVFLDPIDSPGAWNKNEAFAYLHSQSTRLYYSDFGGGAGAGMDDRFDFILLSENFFKQTSDLQYLEGSYTAYGNNGNCYRKRINDPDCSGKYTQLQRSWLYAMSDHLPIVLELETQRKLLNTPEYRGHTKSPIILVNPVKDILEIQLPETSISPSYIKIIDPLGRTLIYKQIEFKTNVLRIPVEHLSPGMYFVQFSSYLTQSIKFIKN